MDRIGLFTCKDSFHICILLFQENRLVHSSSVPIWHVTLQLPASLESVAMVPQHLCSLASHTQTHKQRYTDTQTPASCISIQAEKSEQLTQKRNEEFKSIFSTLVIKTVAIFSCYMVIFWVGLLHHPNLEIWLVHNSVIGLQSVIIFVYYCY